MAVVLVVVSLLTQLVYPWFPYDLMDGNWPIVAVQCLRIAGLLAATGIAIRQISRRPPRAVPRDEILAEAGPASLSKDRHSTLEGEWTYAQEGRSR